MSASSVSLRTDVNVRYERLAVEFSKLRSQAKVLREGVLTERQKNQKLADEATAKDISIRKLRTENESLSFRNDQLAKRIEALQIEVELCSKKDEPKFSKKSKQLPADVVSSMQTLNQRISILEEELSNKLRQNEEYVIKLAEQERTHCEEIRELSAKFRAEIEERESHEQSKNLTTENGTFCKNTSVQNAVHLQNLCSEDKAATESLVSASSPIMLEELHCHLTDSVRAILSDGSNLFQLLSQRCELYPFDATMEELPSYLVKFASVCGQCCSRLNSCIDILDATLERKEWNKTMDSDAFTSAFSLFSTDCVTSIPDLLTATCESENKVTWADSRLENLNIEWCNTFSRFLQLISSLNSLLNSKNLSDIKGVMLEMAETVRALAESFQSRWNLECRFPSANRRIICVCEAIINCLNNFHSNIIKLNARLSTWSNRSSNGIIVHSADETRAELDTPPNCKLQMREDYILTSITTACMTSPIPSCVTTCEKCETLSHDNETFEKKNTEISQLTERLSQLESERERHLVDLSLLRHKITLAGGDSKTVVSNDDADYISQFTKNRLKELVDEKQTIISSARYYQTECSILLRKMRSCQDQRSTLEEQIAAQQKQNSELADELASVRRGYEFQLSSMTEHVADLSEKLASLEIESDKKPIPSKGFTRRSFFK